MRKKYLYILFFFAVVLLLMPALHPAQALEVTYPQLGFGNSAYVINANSNFINYIQYFFVLAVVVAGIIAVISLVISGLQILVYGGSPQALGDAKERFLGSVVGIGLLMASVIILQTINPSLVALNATQLPAQTSDGVFLDAIYTKYDGGNIPNPPGTVNYDLIKGVAEMPAPQSDPNLAMPPPRAFTVPSILGVGPFTANFVSDGAYYQIRYRCTPPTDGSDGPRLLVWKYNQTDFKIDPAENGSPRADTYSLPCNSDPTNKIDLQNNPPNDVIKSYKWAIEQPGVYFYLRDDAVGVSSDVYTSPSSMAGDSAPFTLIDGSHPSPVSMRIVNSRQDQYAVVLNESPSGQPIQECSYPYFNKNVPQDNNLVNSQTLSISNNANGDPFSAEYAYVFKQTTPPRGGSLSFYAGALNETLFTKLDSSNFNDSTKGGEQIDNQGQGRAYHLESDTRGGYYGNLNKLLRSEVNGGQGQPNPSGTTPPASECDGNSLESCLRSTEVKGNNAFYRIILYGGNENDDLNEHCQIYTCQNNNFNAGNNNRWIFNNSELVYDMYVIPMPSPACGGVSP